MSWVKNVMLVSVTSLTCFCLMVIGDWFLERQLALNLEPYVLEAKKIEKERIFTEDVIQKERAINEGYFPTIFPTLMDELQPEYPLLAGLPSVKTYYCNEGYGLVKYISDRFGFRNNDVLWNEDINFIFIGDSFIHGACVSNNQTIPAQFAKKTQSNVLNLGMGAASPTHYYTYASIFIPRIRPSAVFLNFYPNDNGQNEKSVIEHRYLDKKIKVIRDDRLQLLNAEMFSDQGRNLIQAIMDKDTEKKPTLVQRALSAFYRHSSFPAIKSLLFQEVNGFRDTARVINGIFELCLSHNCNLQVSFIPNSKFFRPDSRADVYGDKIAKLTSELGVQFVDGRNFLNREKYSEDFAIKGPHLSPVGYKKMADSIASEFLKQ